MTRSAATCSHKVALGAIALSLVAIVIGAARSQSEDAKPGANTGPAAMRANVPEYNEKGELKLPADFYSWVFVGANLGIEYGDALKAEADPPQPPAAKGADKSPYSGNFHNIYINPEAYAHYVRTGKFPEKTMLVLDIYKADEGEPKSIVSQGRYPGKQSGVAMAVKDSARPDGSKTVWAYYDFDTDKKVAKASPDKACHDCHLKHASDDNVWVQFYPVLRRLKR